MQDKTYSFVITVWQNVPLILPFYHEEQVFRKWHIVEPVKYTKLQRIL